MTQAKVQLVAADDVPVEIIRTIRSKLDAAMQRIAAGSHVEVHVEKRDNPDEIYGVSVSNGTVFQQDFQPGDIESERFDIWLNQQGGHLAEHCWCRHPPEDHSPPRCTSCETG